jgi:hypothetical protein
MAVILWFLKSTLLAVVISAVAIGDTSIAERHLRELQSGFKSHKPGTEPEPGTKEEGLNPQNKLHTDLLLGGQLETLMGACIVDWDNGWTLHLEVHAVS